MAIKLDLSKFKKVSGDKDHTIMRHEDGHEFKLAHRGLPPKMRGELAALPMAQEKDAAKPSKEAAKADKPRKAPKKMATGGEVSEEFPLDGASVADPAGNLIPSPGVSGVTGGMAAPMSGAMGPTGAMGADPSIQVPSDLPGPTGVTGPSGAMQPAQDGPQGPPGMGPTLSNAPSPQALNEAQALSEGRDIAGAQPAANGPAQMPQASGGSADSYQGQMKAGYDLQKKGIEEKASAEKALGRSMEDIAAAHIKENEAQVAKEQSAQADAVRANQAFVNDVKKGFIKPNQYMDGLSTPQRVTTAIGIMLSGLGSGLSGQQNMAMKYLEGQIERDIKAQERNLGSSENLLHHNLLMTKDMRDARNLTRVMINEGYAHQIEQAAAHARTPQAEAAKNMALGQLAQQNAFILSGMGKGPGKGDQGSQMDEYLNMLRVAAPDRAKELEARYIPGVGVASVPIDAKARSEVSERKSLQEQVHNLRQWAQKHSGTLNPAEVAYGRALANTVQDAYRRANGQGVFKESEADFVKGIVEEHPDKFFNAWRVDPKYKALENSNAYALQGLYNSLGIKPMGGSASQPQSAVRFTPKGK